MRESGERGGEYSDNGQCTRHTEQGRIGSVMQSKEEKR